MTDTAPPTPIVCHITREVDVYVAMGYGRDLATQLGFDPVNRTRIEIAILELTRNLLAHAGSGTIRLAVVNDPAAGTGLALEAHDSGPGITNIELAMRDGYSTTATLGAGLPGVQRLMDEFTITSDTSAVGHGTHIRAIKWLTTRHPYYDKERL